MKVFNGKFTWTFLPFERIQLYLRAIIWISCEIFHENLHEITFLTHEFRFVACVLIFQNSSSIFLSPHWFYLYLKMNCAVLFVSILKVVDNFWIIVFTVFSLILKCLYCNCVSGGAVTFTMIDPQLQIYPKYMVSTFTSFRVSTGKVNFSSWVRVI